MMDSTEEYNNGIKDMIISTLKKLTSHKFIMLTPRGNAAILAAMRCAKRINITKQAILVPDQGGWLTYLQYPKKLNLKVEKLKTDYGVIDINDLQQKSKDACALIYSSPAGYFAEQPTNEIYDICKKNNCIVILDVTGSVGKTKDNADFLVCSFGEWKPVNLHYGGFISTNNKAYFEQCGNIFSGLSFDESYLKELQLKLSELERKYKLFEEAAKKVKEDLSGFDIIHRDKQGLNVVVKFGSNDEKEKIINYCEKHSLQYTECPRYIRVNERAISIEIKRA